MKKTMFKTAMAWFLSLALAAGAWAELAYVSGTAGPVDADGDPAEVALFPAAPWDPVNEELLTEGDYRGAGFPIWYQDTTGLQLTLCLDGEEESFPCGWEGSPVFTDSECTEPLYPYQDVVGFGDEAFYFKATSHPFDVPLEDHPVDGASAQLALLLETTWGEDTRFDENTGRVGDQDIFIEEEDGTCVSAVGADLHRVAPGSELLFSRIRLRLLGDQAGHAGWYRITHPYGVKTFYHLPEVIDDDEGDDRSQVRQQVGDFSGTENPDYTIVLNDPDTLIGRFGQPTALANYVDVGGSNVTDIDQSIGFSNDASVGLKNIGPFLVKPDYLEDPDLRIPILDEDGNETGLFHQYIGNPIEEPDSGHAVIGSPFLDPRGPTNDGTPTLANYFKIEFFSGNINTLPSEGTEGWTIVGFTDLFNVAGKVANCDNPDNVAPLTVDDSARVRHGGQVIIPVLENDDPDGSISPIRTTSIVITDPPAQGTATVNGDGTITYVSDGEFLESVEFKYQVSDHCGLLSEEATVTVFVEDLQLNQAEFRVRLGKWDISGTSSHRTDNRISLYVGAYDADNPESNLLIGEADVDENGNWTFSGKSVVSPAGGSVTAVSALEIHTEPMSLLIR
ncbi:Ig-like domain-containing protein [Geoalkalibacter halelectricus]|uniref:Ig-like domain-containing protein n=1 Tax=Geoalkalibacter halelectricus TaxID=2847045 RepID=A0ABY5ZQZ5_9BACT|nr:Ig-like domain-containing protein [Geoalkalibacter halelectricus]MDO3378360.1 Ig-like domain-containing protein [Geoalkalibacter halelectricus]UWZ80320.1 Ig-like domain-containing protein [Geoalkalibacter halelectricus]